MKHFHFNWICKVVIMKQSFFTAYTLKLVFYISVRMGERESSKDKRSVGLYRSNALASETDHILHMLYTVFIP